MSDESRRERVLGAVVDTLYRQSGPTTFAALLVIAVFAVFQWDRQPASRLVPWLVLQCIPVALGFARGVLYRRRHRAEAPNPRPWLSLFLANLAGLSAIWGLGTLLFFNANDLIGTSIAVVFSAGVTAGALLGVSSHPSAFALFAGLALTPSIVLCLAAQEREYTTLGLGLIAFLLFGLAASRNLQKSFERSMELRFENEELADRLRREKERAERALSQKSKVLAAASHDLRQPLHALGMFVELLSERLRGDEERAFLARIEASAQALGGLLNALLDISRLDSNSIQVRREHFRLAPLFDQLAAEYSESARRKGLAFRVSGGDLVVESDSELVARLVRNLLSNAVRFTATGEVSLSARSTPEGRVEIAVTDTGPGIPEAERGKIFEEFHQIGNAERDREQGLGLGLAIVRGLSRLLEHPLVVRSFPERAVGSEFALELPAGDAKLAREEEAQSSRPPHGLAGRHILIIDDERDIRDGLGALLESWGSTSVRAGGLEEALAQQAARAGVPDLVICDYRLRDGATGAAVLAELEARWQRKVPCVIITGDTSPERIHEAKRSGRPVLFKPVVPGKLRALLTALVERAADPAR